MSSNANIKIILQELLPLEEMDFSLLKDDEKISYVKKELTKRLLNLTITSTQLEWLMDNINKEELADITKRIFDLNDGQILNRSDAASGVMGYLNERSRKGREKEYYKKIRKGFRSEADNMVIFAEGDSWFEYPIAINEIIDWLCKEEQYAIFSQAYGADWLSNILYQGRYIEDLQIHCPDVFLISGGGNDLVGGNRIASLVQLAKEAKLDPYQERKLKELFAKQDLDTHTQDKLIRGSTFLSKDYEALMLVFCIQYTLLFKSLYVNTNKFEHMITITQGYDYAIPSFNRGFGWNPFKLHKPITNILLDNGGWLKQPLMIKGITDQKDQEAIIFTMIFEFNEMLINAGKKYPKHVFHIDCRDITKPHEWYNELHPESQVFKKIANTYKLCMTEAIKALKQKQPVAFNVYKVVTLNKLGKV